MKTINLDRQLKNFKKRKTEATVETKLSNAEKLTARLQKELAHAERIIRTMDLTIKCLIHQAGGVADITGEEMIHAAACGHDLTDTVTKDGLQFIEWSGHIVPKEDKNETVAFRSMKGG